MSSVVSENWVHCAKTRVQWTTMASCCGFAKQSVKPNMHQQMDPNHFALPHKEQRRGR